MHLRYPYVHRGNAIDIGDLGQDVKRLKRHGSSRRHERSAARLFIGHRAQDSAYGGRENARTTRHDPCSRADVRSSWPIGGKADRDVDADGLRGDVNDLSGICQRQPFHPLSAQIHVRTDPPGSAAVNPEKARHRPNLTHSGHARSPGN